MNEKNRMGLDEGDNFCITVLTKAKEIFGEDADKIDDDKMVMLCCVVADDVNYPLTKGWFK